MKKFLFESMTFGLIIFLSAANATELNYVEGEALVVFKTDFENVQVSAADVDSEIVENYEALSKVDTEANLKLADSDLDSSLRRFVLIRSKNKTTEQLISELKNRPDVIAASPNYKVRRNLSAVQEELIPNDSSFDVLWGIKKIRAPEVWTYTTGSRDIFVGVIDSGIYQHEDLNANIASEYGLNTTTVDGEFDVTFSAWNMDRIGHGTHVAGTIGAVGDNSIGVAGVNWQVSLIPLRIFDDNDYETINQEIRVLNHIAGLLDADPDLKIASVNLSLGAYLPYTPEEMQKNVYWMAYRTLDRMNRTLIVVAAGNDGLEVGKPAPFDDPFDNHSFSQDQYCYPTSFSGLDNLIVVGAIVSDDTAAYFTNFGNSVDIAAPGYEIFSTYSPLNGANYIYQNGTSMATPHVAGAIALLKSAFPNATTSQIKKALLEGANKNINPEVHFYEYFMKLEREIIPAEVDELIAGGYIEDPSKRDQIIASAIANQEKTAKIYQTLDAAGKVSKNGLLDVKAAYDILANENKNSERSSSSGGCNVGLSFVALSLCLLVKNFLRKCK